MMEKILEYIEKHKDSTWLLPFRFLNRISVEPVKEIYFMFYSIYVPLLYEYNPFNGIKKIYQVVFLSIVFIWFQISNQYKIQSYKKYEKNKDLVNNLIKLEEYINLLNLRINSEIKNNKEEIFKIIADEVVCYLYDFLKDVYKIETRISVVQQYKNDRGVRACKIISRRSKYNINSNRKEFIIKKKNIKYYFFKILLANKEQKEYLNSSEIEKNKKFKTKKDVKEYLAVPVKDNSPFIEFILQIDIMGKETFCNDEQKINEFLNYYIYPYVNILRLAYSISEYK